jgi:hypothetical protein
MVNFSKDTGDRLPGKARRQFLRLPYDRLEERLEAVRFIDGGEIELHQDVAVIVDWLVDSLCLHAGPTTSFAESTESAEPRCEIRDRVFDVQRRHGIPFEVRTMHPRATSAGLWSGMCARLWRLHTLQWTSDAVMPASVGSVETQ